MTNLHDKSKLLFANTFGPDLFGDPGIGRIKLSDPLNRYMYNALLKDYIGWHEKTHRFYPNYEKDKSRMNFLYYTQYLYAAGGVLLAGMVINPNYTTPRSYYLRKFNILFLGWIGFTFGMRNYETLKVKMFLRMNDYFPLEIKRALATQDYRHFALFDYNNPGRQLFDEETGKSLS
mmetsp:Transcript_23277/g.20645  ORF Transcript_23277/g.20645 Transcript_23277/m.20645 type:complete len:176 (+) Transcript_23277:36-563(+)